MSSPQKPPMPQDVFKEFQDAVKDRELIPEADRAEYEAFLKSEWQKAVEEYDQPLDAEGPLDAIGDAYGRFVDYGSGLLRTGVAGVTMPIAELATGKDIITTRDLIDTAKGRAPGFGEYFERAGVPEGGRLSDIVPGYSEPLSGGLVEKGGMLDPTLRGTVATGLDVALAPGGLMRMLQNRMANQALKKAPITAKQATAMRMLEREKQLANTAPGPRLWNAMKETGKFALDPLDYSLRHGGEKAYRSAFRAEDLAAKNKNATPASDTFLRDNFWGSEKAKEQRGQALLDQSNKRVEQSVQHASRSVPGGMGGVLTEDVVSPELREIIESGTGRKLPDVLDAEQLNELKQTLHALEERQGGFSDRARPIQPARNKVNILKENKLNAQVADSADTARTELENLLDDIHPGDGFHVQTENRKQAGLIKSKKARAEGAEKSLAEHAKDAAPGSALGAAGLGIPAYMLFQNPLLVGGLTAAGLGLGTTTARTGLGLAAHRGAYPLSGLIRQESIESKRQKSPWRLLMENMEDLEK